MRKAVSIALDREVVIERLERTQSRHTEDPRVGCGWIVWATVLLVKGALKRSLRCCERVARAIFLGFAADD